MDVCKQCGKELVHADGRRKKTFCNDTCRSNFWYEKNVKNKPKTIVRNLNTPTNEKKPATQPKSDYTVDNKDEIIERILTLNQELLHPPKNPIIGQSKWIAVRKQELKELQEKLDQ